MTRLRFVELTHDAGALILTDESGEQHFELPVTSELRKALVRAPRKHNDSQPVSLSPKDIQMRIRQGATIHEIAIETGLPAERVRAFATPVLAERSYAAETARRLPVADPTLSRDALRRVFGEDPVSLEKMVAYRAEEIGLDPESLDWDAWKRTDALWELQLTFEVVDTELLEKEELADGDYSARWVYHPLRKSVTNANNWARLLSELEPLEQAAPRLTPVQDETDDRPEDSASSEQAPQDAAEARPESPVGDLAQRRERRRLADAAEPAQASEEAQEQDSAEEDKASRAPEQNADAEPRDDAAEKDDAERPAPRKRSVKDRSTRSRVPSWDQIYFGTKPDKDSRPIKGWQPAVS